MELHEALATFAIDPVTREMLFESKLLDGRIQYVPKVNMTHTVYLLEDGSLMRVPMTVKTKEALEGTSGEKDTIIAFCKEGWQKEANELVSNGSWTRQQADSYMTEYNKKKITDRVADVPNRNKNNIAKEVAKVKKDAAKAKRKGRP